MRVLPILALAACAAPTPIQPSGPIDDPSASVPTEPTVPDPGTTEPQVTTPTETIEAVDCSPIASDPGFELCEETEATCSGVYTDGSGCEAYCAAAGLECVAAYGGEPGCQLEANNPLPCGYTGHQSDWCDCALPADPGDCLTDPAATELEQGLNDLSFTERHNWVVECRDYAYSASGDEHEACDPTYNPDGSRTGTATFTFSNVPRGTYEVFVGGRHTENRNPSGALFVVDGHAVVIDQTDPSGDMVWDRHGTWCLEGTVEVTLDSTVNGGSDSVFGARLVPVF